MVSIPQLNSCCCGCPLRTGSLIIGWLFMIASAIHSFFIGLSLLFGKEQLPPGQYKTAAGTVLLGDLVAIFIVGLFLNGVYKKKPAYMVPFLAISTLATVTYSVKMLKATIVLGIAAAIESAPAAEDDRTVLIIVIAFFIITFLIVFLFYLQLVMYSYYNVLKRDSQSPAQGSGGNTGRVLHTMTRTASSPYNPDFNRTQYGHQYAV